MDFSPGFWAVPDLCGTIPGRNRARRLFFIMRQADAFARSQDCQNEQNQSKNDTKSKIPILGWDASVTSWIVQGRLKRYSCEFWTFYETNYRVAEHTCRIFSENLDLWASVIFEQSRFDQTAYLPYGRPQPCQAGSSSLGLIPNTRLTARSLTLRFPTEHRAVRQPANVAARQLGGPGVPAARPK